MIASFRHDFSSFIDHNDSVYLEFLKGNWKEFNLQMDSIREKKKPVIQPRVEGIVDTTIDIVENIKGLEDTKDYKLEVDTAPESNSLFYHNNTCLDFYGHISYLPVLSEVTTGVTIDDGYITGFFNKYRKDANLLAISDQLKVISKELKLNDFGFFLLILQAAATLYPDVNSRGIFAFINLILNGFDAKIGYRDNWTLYLFPVTNPSAIREVLLFRAQNIFCINYPGSQRRQTLWCRFAVGRETILL
jgi:hypothetical protein